MSRIYKVLNYISIFLLIILNYSCENSQDEEIIDDISEYPDSVQADFISIPEFLTDFSNKWTQLLYTDTAYILFHPCDARISTIEIVNKSGKYYIILNWDFDSTIHLINYIIKKENKYFINSDFGEYHFDFTVTFFDKNQNHALWEWSWKTAFNGSDQTFSKVFAPDNALNEYSQYTQPCIECYEIQNCSDYLKDFEKRKTFELIENEFFNKRIHELISSGFPYFLDYFDREEIISKTNDRYFLFDSKPDTSILYRNVYMIIDLEDNVITLAYKKKDKSIEMISETEKKLLPEFVTEWISKGK